MSRGMGGEEHHFRTRSWTFITNQSRTTRSAAYCYFLGIPRPLLGPPCNLSKFILQIATTVENDHVGSNIQDIAMLRHRIVWQIRSMRLPLKAGIPINGSVMRFSFLERSQSYRQHSSGLQNVGFSIAVERSLIAPAERPVLLSKWW